MAYTGKKKKEMNLVEWAIGGLKDLTMFAGTFLLSPDSTDLLTWSLSWYSVISHITTW